jgi:hypothetical protein
MTDSFTRSAKEQLNRLPGWLSPLALSFLLALLVVLPFFFYGTASGHDFEFHAASWFDVASQWKQGVLFPRWTAWTNHGFGEPRFIFYPPLSWLLGAALTLLFPGSVVPVLFILLVQTFAGLSAYFLLRNLTTQRASVLGAAFYAINPNALLMIYIRSDFAEQFACAFFPLLLLAALRICGFLDDSGSPRRSVALFALLFAAVWLSNAPAAVIASYSMALLFAWAALSLRSWRPLVRGIVSLAFGLALAAFYIVPAAYEQRWVNIGQALSSGLLPSQNFLFTAIDDPEHTWFNWIASICAISLILLLALAAFASDRFASDSKHSNRYRSLSAALLVLGTGATLLTLRISSPVWTYLPKLRFVQFPWRWMSIIALVAACFLAFAMEKRFGWLWFVTILILTVPLARFQIQNTWWDSDEMATMRDALDSGHGFDGTDEYDPLGDDHANLPTDAPLVALLPADSLDGSLPVSPAKVDVQHWTTMQKLVRVDTQVPAHVALRVLNYPAWRVSVNGNPVSPERLDDFNQMVVPVGKGVSEIRVRFTRTPDRTIGDVVSLGAALVVAVLLWNRQRSAAVRFLFRPFIGQLG